MTEQDSEPSSGEVDSADVGESQPTWEEINQALYVANRQLAGLIEANDRLEQRLLQIEPELLRARKATSGVALPIGQFLARTFASPIGLVRVPLSLARLIADVGRRRRLKAAKNLLMVSGYSVIPTISLRRLGYEGSHHHKKLHQLSHAIRPDKPFRQIFEKLLSQAAAIPPSNGSQYHESLPLNVAIVTDEFMFNYYRNAFRKLVYLTPDTFEQAFAENEFQVFIFVSCWSGMIGDEWRGIGYREKPKHALERILQLARERGVATMFQTIEDPSNFEQFLPIARQFEHVFTTDIDCVARYRSETEARTVSFAEFGANPLFNNPIGMRRHAYPGAFFAGSYPSRYPERCKDMHTVFDSLIESDVDLIIADRNSDRPSDAFAFPATYQNHLIPKLEHELLQKVHKVFAYNVNFNSIKNSPTMCAMRVYELQAQGSLLLSNYARSVVNSFPMVDVLSSKVDAARYLRRSETTAGYERRVIGVRSIMNSRTSYDQARRMMLAAGVDCGIEPKHCVLVVLLKDTAELHSMFERQNYPHKTMIPRDLVEGEDLSEYAYVTFFSAGNEYEPDYLGDMVNGFKYTAARYITKAAWFDGATLRDGPQHEFVDSMPALERTLFDTSHFNLTELLAFEPEQALPGGYSIDPFELNYTRHVSANATAPDSYLLSVVIPVYNNGEFLRHKCIESLSRNDIFERMELVIVDDGSSDATTLRMLELIERRYPNARVHRFDRGGSGSASRPRNKGIELARSPLITFLDPDNEISAGGYDMLVSLHRRLQDEGRRADLVTGYQIKVGDTQSITAKHTSLALEVFEDPHRDLLLARNFPIISTQAAVIDLAFLRRTAVDFVVGAVGQDTLFAYELLHHAGRVAVTGAAHIVYYAERESSVTNALNLRFFEKSVTLERVQVERLRKAGLLETYRQKKFAPFFSGWYMQKYKATAESVQPAAREMLLEISRLYNVDSRYLFDQKAH